MADDLATVRHVLAALRRERVPFVDAWAIACPSSRPDRERVALRQALDATAEAWERAYLGKPPSAGETAAATLIAWAQPDAAEDRSGELVGVRVG
jgi:Flp pilus assembly CpaE family ATPase